MKQHLTFWLLKFTGALVGFWVFSALIIGLALVLYYLHLSPLPAVVRAGLALIPLFFGYVVARRIPVDRYKLFAGRLQLYPADTLFLIAFALAGPLTAVFLYLTYEFLIDRTLAPIVLLITLAGVFFWEYRRQKGVRKQ